VNLRGLQQRDSGYTLHLEFILERNLYFLGGKRNVELIISFSLQNKSLEHTLSYLGSQTCECFLTISFFELVLCFLCYCLSWPGHTGKRVRSH